MKYRNGFVSNSSSSSYIIAIAKILDIKRVKAIIGDCLHCDIVTASTPEDMTIESFNGDAVSLSVKKNDQVLCILAVDNEGDSSFWNGVYCDYDIAYEDCNSQVLDIIETLKDSGVIESMHLSYGAGRNG
jgi:hypothetical protein